MSATKSTDFVFEPKVWKDHIRAYFDKKLVFGALAAKDNTLTASPGETINFPYFKAIGAVETPDEDTGLSVDKLQDDSFQATVSEVGKAVGLKKKAFMKSAAAKERIVQEIQEQLGRVHAEKVDARLVTEINTSGNYTQGYLATVAANVMTIRTLLQAKIIAFGDKHDQAIAVQMHSRQFYDLLADTTAGWLKADANDPFWGMAGFEGRFVGLAVFTSDQTPSNGAQIDSKDAFHAFIHKMTPYGLCYKEEMGIEMDYDILAREWVWASDEWYAVKSFHAKISGDDKKTARVTTTVSI